MNLVSRVKSSAHLILHYHLPRKYLFVSHPMTSFQQSIFYSTRTANSTPKTQQFSKPRTQKSSDSSVSFSEVKKQAEALTVWPRPREIPYQAKVANFVKIIGYVNNPVKFEVDSDGKHWAATVISQEHSIEKSSLLIPVVFEGDLAHVVACHVKANDCVFVCGQLSTEPMRLGFSESLGRFHVMGENLNFVEGLKRNVLGHESKKKGAETSGVEIGKPISPVAKKLEGVTDGGDACLDENENPQGVLRDVFKSWKIDSLGVKNELKSSDFVGESFTVSTNTETKAGSVVQLGNDNKTVYKDKFKPEKWNVTSGDAAGKNKDGDTWRDLVINPLQWWDYREHKSNGLVKAKFPDFKHKATGESLWLNTAPEWVLAGLGKLEIDVKHMTAKPVQVGEGFVDRKMDGKGDVSWKNLVENPDKWWDNRSNKRNPKSPDFKHKETGEVIWLKNLPGWALSRLPPLKDGQNSQSL